MTTISEPQPLTPAQLAAYEAVLAQHLTGAEQGAMRERSEGEYEAWLTRQLAHVPMPSAQKPEINGYREGDRVALVRRFVGESGVTYEAGRAGIFLVTNTAPAQVRLARQGFYEVAMLGPDGRLIGVGPGDIEKVPGRVNVTYAEDHVWFTPADE